jgi:hypothetical protein
MFNQRNTIDLTAALSDSSGSDSDRPLRPKPLEPSQVIKNVTTSKPMSSLQTEAAFGSSISKQRPTGYSSYIKPATPGAFKSSTKPSRILQSDKGADPPGYVNGWPAWVQKGHLNPGTHLDKAGSTSKLAPPPEDNVETFNLDAIPMSAEDYDRHHGDAEEHMRELLSGAVGDGEDDDAQEGEELVEGFAKGVRLMPHQIRGTRWMRQRETGRKYGGILADVSLTWSS